MTSKKSDNDQQKIREHLERIKYNEFPAFVCKLGTHKKKLNLYAREKSTGEEILVKKNVPRGELKYYQGKYLNNPEPYKKKHRKKPQKNTGVSDKNTSGKKDSKKKNNKKSGKKSKKSIKPDLDSMVDDDMF